jgi:hypothetical protein
MQALGVEKFTLDPMEGTDPYPANLWQRVQAWMRTDLPNAQLVIPSSRWLQFGCAAFPFSFWDFSAPTLGDATAMVICANDPPSLVQLPLATFGSNTWEGKRQSPAQTLSNTLSWLYGEKARASLRVWINSFSDHLFMADWATFYEATPDEFNAPRLAEALARWQAALPQLDTTRDQGLLRGVLLKQLLQARQRLTALENDANYERTESGIYRRRNP